MTAASAAAQALRAQLDPTTHQRLSWLHWVDEVDSSNAELLRLAAGLPPRALLVADRQTAGRGRQGRRWSMAGDGNIALSLFARIARPAEQLAGLSLAIGIGCADALRRLGVDAVGLKWPNDLVARRRKLGGVLIELAGSRAGQSDVVIGLGLNRHLDAGADPDWIDLHQLGAAQLDRVALVALLAAALLSTVDAFERDGMAGFVARWDALDALRGQPARVLAASGEHLGTVLGIRDDGALRLSAATGEHCFVSAEVSLRPL